MRSLFLTGDIVPGHNFLLPSFSLLPSPYFFSHPLHLLLALLLQISHDAGKLGLLTNAFASSLFRFTPGIIVFSDQLKEP